MQLLKKRKEFERVFKKGRRINRPHVSICYLVSKGNTSKFAFVAPKRLGNAVFRNRCKRLLREAVRGVSPTAKPLEVIFFATPRTSETHPACISEEINKVFQKEMMLQ